MRRYTGDALGRLLRLPPPSTEFDVHRGLRVPMRDGIDLIADHYVPTTPSPAGTVLVRGPYGRGWPFSALFGAVYAARGYHVLIQSVRGTFGSGGVFTPMIHEVADGADTVDWLRNQAWFTGSFATVGLSYLGFNQWALLQDPPPEMKAAVIAVGPHDLGASSWGSGSFSLNDFLGWSDLVAHQEDPGRIRALVRQLRARRLVAGAANGLPLGEAGRALLGAGAPWYESWLQPPDQNEAFWSAHRLTEALDRVQIPVLLIGGWQDLFLQQTLAQYQHLRRRRVTVALTVGPWTHTHMMTKSVPTVARESLDWLETHSPASGRYPQARRRTAARSPVRIHINGHGWIDLPDWPPALPEHVLYLQPAGRLADTEPSATAPASVFTYHPADPTPTVGGRLLSPEGGYRDDTRLGWRADVLTFTGDPSCGPVRRRDPGGRAGPLQRQPPQRPVRPGERGGRQGVFGQCHRRIPTPHTCFRSPIRRHRRFRHSPHRPRRDRTPVPRRITDPPSRRRWVASAVRPQSGHRRTTHQRPTARAGHPHRAPR